MKKVDVRGKGDRGTQHLNRVSRKGIDRLGCEVEDLHLRVKSSLSERSESEAIG